MMGNNPTERTKVAIIGAGMAGLACAARLSARPNLDVVIYEADAEPGGRLSTRVESVGRFDAGAQFLTCHDPAFAVEIERLKEAGTLHPWLGRFCRMQDGEIALQTQDLIQDRFLGNGGMSVITDFLSGGLNILTSHKLEEYSRSKEKGHRWTMTFSTPNALVHDTADIILLAIPAPAAADFLSPAPGMRLSAHKAEYAACWSLMLAFDETLETSFDALSMERNRHARASLPTEIKTGETGWPNAWICRETGKPGRVSNVERWVLHAAPEYSNARMHAEPEQVAADMLAGFRAVLPRVTIEPSWKKAILYPHARVSKPVGEDCLFNGDMGLGAAGDWCIGASAERAWLSGAALAHRVLVDLANRNTHVTAEETATKGGKNDKRSTGTWRDWLR